MEIFEDHAVYEGKTISLYEAACILARAMGRIYGPIVKDDGYMYEDIANGVERFGLCAWVHGEEDNDA